MGPQQNFVSQALNSLIDWLVMQTPAETAVAIAASYVAKAFCIKTGTRCAMPGASALNAKNGAVGADTAQRLDRPPYPRPTSRPSSSPRSSIRILTAGSFEFGVDAMLSD
jgi:hypothetical protein